MPLPSRYLMYMALVSAIVGVTILLGIPSESEGPLIIAISDEHVIRFVDAIGVAFILAGNFLLFKILLKRRKRLL